MAKKAETTAKNKKKEIEKELIEEEEEIEELDDEEFAEEIEEDLNDEEFDEEFEPATLEDRVASIEKKEKTNLILNIISLVLIIVTLIGVFAGESVPSNNNNEETDPTSYSYDTSLFKEIAVKDIASASKKEKIIIMVGRQGCSWCASYAPIIGMAAQENGFTLHYIDFAKIIDFTQAQPTISDEEAYDGLINLIENSEFKDDISQGIGTPMTLFVKNNKLVNFINGYTDESGLNTILKKEGFSK